MVRRSKRVAYGERAVSPFTSSSAMRLSIVLWVLSCALFVAVSGAGQEGKEDGSDDHDDWTVIDSPSQEEEEATAASDDQEEKSEPPARRAQQQDAKLAAAMVYGAETGDEQPAMPTHQHDEAAAMAYVAHGDHANAAESYTRAAEHFEKLASDLERKAFLLIAANCYVKSAALYAAATEQKALVGLNSGRCHKGRLMHKRAADHFCELAKRHAAADDLVQALAMSRAAAEQYDMSAKCAWALCEHEAGADACRRASQIYTAMGDVEGAQRAKEAEAQHVDRAARC